MPEPIPIEMYKCPVCQEELRMSREQARQEINIMPFFEIFIPRGLIVEGKYEYFLVSSSDTLIGHTKDKKDIHCRQVRYTSLDEKRRLGSGCYWSNRSFLDFLQNGALSLLSEEAFESIAQPELVKYALERNLQLVRTTHEIDAFLKDKTIDVFLKEHE
ncbi:hypothetical protein GF358_04010 [Candidatus Woesearchaeota archaeon]|nr:hypothetical protein [Candidatus Woesearchaeota archaeon]